jgi:hypothetical protein
LKAALRIAHVELQKCARGFAGAEAHDDVPDADRLARFHLKLAGDPVALVEKADHGKPFRHRRRAGGDFGDGLRHVHGFGLGRVLGLRSGCLATAGAERAAKSERGGEARRAAHPCSGVQA